MQSLSFACVKKETKGIPCPVAVTGTGAGQLILR